MAQASLDPVLRPKSIAIVGASPKRGTIGGELFANIMSSGFTGVAYPVNPVSTSVQAVKAYRTVLELPEAPDLVVVAVPAKAVAEVIDQCIERGAKAVLVISAGFKEVGGDGVALEAELTNKVRSSGIRMIGPNCLGVINLDPEVSLNATFSPSISEPGRVAFMSQSGGLGVAILDQSRELGLGLSSFVSIGNKADVSGNDLLEFWESDANTEIVLLYLESFGNPRKFTKIARRLAKKKPIVVVKSGRSVSGQRAASSHTGALAGIDVAVDALFSQAGVIRTDTIEELFNTAMILANQPIPKGRRVAVLTNAGGPGILAADACEYCGLELPTLSDDTKAELRAILPSEASVTNPVDMVAAASGEQFQEASKILLASGEVDILMVIFVPPLVTSPDDVADAIAAAAAVGSEHTVVACLMGAHGVMKGRQSLRDDGIPSFAFPEAAAVALSRIATYSEWRQRPAGQLVQFESVDRNAVSTLLAGGSGEPRWLESHVASSLLAAYGIPTASVTFARTTGEAAEAAKQIGFPVAVKLASQTLVHKTDVGGVRLNLQNEEEVLKAFQNMRTQLEEKGLLDAMDGVHVQQMVEGGQEVILGCTDDPAFGPLMMFGLGGTYVELLKDVVFRLHPLRDRDAEAMVEGIKARLVLDGYRGSEPVDKAAIVDVLLRLSQLVGDFPQIAEIEMNPLRVMPAGQGAVSIDCRIRVYSD